VPITPYGVAVPMPVALEVHYGEPMVFSGTGNEEDTVIHTYVDQVKAKVASLLESGRQARRARKKSEGAA
jgi:hypothetical protein